MRHAFLAAAAMAALAAGAAFAGPLGDAKSGLTALDKGDNLTAVRLFTAAIDSRQLGRSDQELAYVKRGEAYLASHQAKPALADANHALDLDPGDKEAVATRDRAEALLTPQPSPPPVSPAVDEKTKADYAAAQARYESEKRAAADAYTRQMADYDAQVKAENDRHAAELATWRANVKACSEGVAAKCGAPVEPPVVAKAIPIPKPAVAKPPAAKPVAASVKTSKPGVGATAKANRKASRARQSDDSDQEVMPL